MECVYFFAAVAAFVLVHFVYVMAGAPRCNRCDCKVTLLAVILLDNNSLEYTVSCPKCLHRWQLTSEELFP